MTSPLTTVPWVTAVRRVVSVLPVVAALPVQSTAQVAVEVPMPTVSAEYAALRHQPSRLDDLGARAAVASLEDALRVIDDPRERFDLIYWELAPRYAELGRYREALDALRRGQREGLVFPWREQVVPFMRDMGELDGYETFVAENDRLGDAARVAPNTEYIVQLPDDRVPGRRYPLVVVFHGGWGSHVGLLPHWQSRALRTDAIVAYVQGSLYEGTNLHRYPVGDDTGLLTAYRQVVRDYPVDVARVVVAGQSAGGARALTLALSGSVQASGLLLVFPTVPWRLPDAELREASSRGMRVAIIAGEEDWALPRQKVLSVMLDTHGVPNRLVVASGVGHDYPPDFARQIDLSLSFILDPG